MNKLAEDNFNALKYESTEDKEKKNSILNQISALNQEYYECMHDWEQRLNHFVNFLPSGYYKVKYIGNDGDMIESTMHFQKELEITLS